MYKKLFGIKKGSTDEISTKDTSNYKQISVRQETNCDCCCNSTSDCCRDANCPQALCQLCTASLVLPSCVGAIRALQSSFVLHSSHKCCTSSRNWLPATDSLTTSKLHVIASRHCCSSCC